MTFSFRINGLAVGKTRVSHDQISSRSTQVPRRDNPCAPHNVFVPTLSISIRVRSPNGTPGSAGALFFSSRLFGEPAENAQVLAEMGSRQGTSRDGPWVTAGALKWKMD